MSTAHRVPTASSVPSSAAPAAARSDGRRMVGSRLGRARAAHRKTESSSARRRRAAIMAPLREGAGGEWEIGSCARESGGGGFGWVRGRTLQRLLLSCAVGYAVVGPRSGARGRVSFHIFFFHPKLQHAPQILGG